MAEPPITLQAIHDDGPGNLTPTRVVIHATCPNIGYPAASKLGQALGTANYFRKATSGGSAHYVIDVGTEQHCMPDAHIARHAPPNPRSIGIEICAEGGDYARSYTREQWLSADVWPAVVLAAARTRELCARFKIPVVRLSVADLKAGKHGNCGHADVSQAFKQSTHSDPGDGFPWEEFMAEVSGAPGAMNSATTMTGDDVMADVPITVRADGTFRRLITAAEAGKSSAVFGAGWVKIGAGWGTAKFHICQLRGGVVMPGGVHDESPALNVITSVQLLDGCEAVTIEGTASPDADVSAAVILAPR